MSYTAIPGTIDSQPGNLLPGSFLIEVFGDASNTITFSQLALGGFEAGLNTLNFTQTFHVYNATPNAISQITFNHSASYLIVKSLALNNTLVFNQVAEVYAIHHASNTITFNQTAAAEKGFGASNVLVFAQTTVISDYYHNAAINNFFTPIGVATVQKIVTTGATSTLSFVQATTTLKVKFLSASNTFVITAHADVSRYPYASSVITFTQSATYSRILHLHASNTLTFTGSATNNAIFSIHASNTLHFILGEVRDIGFINQVIPGAVITKVNSYILLQTSTSSITLPRPKFDDSEGTLAKLIANKTINNHKFVYVRRSKTRMLKYSFEVDRPKAYEMRQFILDHLADPVTLTNWKGEIWKGFIMNNPMELTAGGRWSPVGDRVDFNVEFEGARIH